jgi:hypothetical protein
VLYNPRVMDTQVDTCSGRAAHVPSIGVATEIRAVRGNGQEKTAGYCLKAH